MTVLERVRRSAEASGWSVTMGDPPEHREDDVLRCLDSCRRNLCGNYGTSWSCPPGWTERIDTLRDAYDGAILLEKRFDIDPKDAEALRRADEELHLLIRMLTAELRASDCECMGFADGRCGYCGVCSYPEPCRFPEQLVPSISSIGVDLEGYLKGFEKSFGFSEDHATLYGLILLKRT